MSNALEQLLKWKLGTHPDVGYVAGSQKFADDVCTLMDEQEAIAKAAGDFAGKVRFAADALDDLKVAPLLASVLRVNCDTFRAELAKVTA